jgi:hypothetical protein
MSNVEKMGLEDVSSLVNKYLDKSESKMTKFTSEVSFNKYDENTSANREYAVMKLKNDQKIKLEDGSLLYERVLNFAQANFLRIDSERFINPSEIAEFIDIDFSVDYSTKDLNKEVEVEDQDWKQVFGDEE